MILRTKQCIVFEKLHPEEYKRFSCGPGGIGDWMVPDTIYGLSMRPACRQHDYDYRFGNGASDEHRKECDARFKKNMHIIVHEESGSKMLKTMRHVRINIYYLSVRAFGSAAYWKER